MSTKRQNYVSVLRNKKHISNSQEALRSFWRAQYTKDWVKGINCLNSQNSQRKDPVIKQAPESPLIDAQTWRNRSL